MADITSRQQGNVSETGKTNWRGDQVTVPQGGQSIYETSSVQLAELGSRVVVGDRVFRYAKAGGTIAAGTLLETQAEQLINVTAGGTVANGAKVFTWYAATAMTKDTYSEGYLISQSGTAGNVGFMYRIKSHPAIAKTTTGTLTLYDPIAHTVDVADKYTLMQNMYARLFTCTTGDGHTPVGVAPIAATTNDFFWIQTWGPCNVKCAAAAAGETMVADATGQVTKVINTSAAGDVFSLVGYAMQTLSNSERGLVFLELAP